MREARPPITPALTLSEFKSWYWLKTELVTLCRSFGLSPSGCKLELEGKIQRYLSGGALTVSVGRKTVGEMPAAFTPQTVIGKGWRCNPALGAYLRKVCGRGFRFNAKMREFIHNGAGEL